MDDQNVCTESNEENICTDSSSDSALQFEASCSTADEQREVLAAEQARAGSAAEQFLPDICLWEDFSALDFSPAVTEPKVDATRPQGDLSCTAATDKSQMIELSNRNFDRIDSDGDGYLSSSEIDEAVQNPEFTGADARFVAALKEHQEELEELNDDEWGDENNGVSRADLAQFDALQASKQQELNDFADASDYMKKNFDSIDTDSDGLVSNDELDTAMQADGLSESDKAKLQYLKDHSSDIEEASDDEIGDENDGISKGDLDSYVKEVFTPSDEAQLVWGVQGTLDKAQKEAERASSRDLFSNSDEPLKDIVPEAVMQGGIGDCYFNSALASLAATNPEAIKDMIHDNGDGTYTVTFPGAPEEPITVSAPTEQELALYSHGSEHGLWAPIMAKAYGAYCNESVFRRSPFNPIGGNVPEEGSDGGSIRNDGLRILTGRGVNSDSMLFTSVDELDKGLSEAFSDGRPVTCYINNFPGEKTSIGLPDGHEYSVTGYDPVSKTVTIRNPWGNAEPTNPDGTPKDGVDDGVFKMPLDEFKKEFSGVAYSQ
ncbi:MAG: hypothetical protein K2X27_09810 [Candidatus Obscuribacterales bacterium]|nr:hypothetical protein [Candidatus Obscuribacterales bacterium]